ncbi:MAG: hypothetical protein C4345_11315 [Chloroflexota bacterium]
MHLVVDPHPWVVVHGEAFVGVQVVDPQRAEMRDGPCLVHQLEPEFATLEEPVVLRRHGVTPRQARNGPGEAIAREHDVVHLLERRGDVVKRFLVRAHVVEGHGHALEGCVGTRSFAQVQWEGVIPVLNANRGPARNMVEHPARSSNPWVKLPVDRHKGYGPAGSDQEYPTNCQHRESPLKPATSLRDPGRERRAGEDYKWRDDREILRLCARDARAVRDDPAQEDQITGIARTPAGTPGGNHGDETRDPEGWPEPPFDELLDLIDAGSYPDVL